MITVRAQNGFDPEAWSERVAACEGNPLHLPAVTTVDYPGVPRVFLEFEEAGRPVGCALAYAPARRRWRIGPAARSLELPTAPALAASPDPLGRKREILETLVDFARKERYEKLVIHPRWGTDLAGIELLGPHIVSPTLEFESDLEGGLEAVRASFHRFHRKNIRRAQRNGLEVVSDPSVAGLLELRRLQAVSAQRSAERGGGFRIREESYFNQLHAAVYARGLGDVLFARQGDRVLAGLAYLHAGSRAITVRSGSTPEGYDQLAMYLLQDAVIERAVGLGVRRINLGGVPEGAGQEGHVQHGLHEFKRGFGGTACLRHGLRMPLGGGGN